MVTPAFVAPLLGFRLTATGNPNTSDSNNQPSVAISKAMIAALGSSRIVPKGENTGAMFEVCVRDFLAARLPRHLQVDRKESITLFRQYAHLGRLDALLRQEGLETVRTELGRDYLIKPDVTVAVRMADDAPPMLHASVSCKWTLRSDRAQNVRHEAANLIRHRRGRLPHIVAVTVEPLPSRIASLAQGTGEADAVYHAALDELDKAVRSIGSLSQVRILDELLDQGRLFDMDALIDHLSI